MPFSFEHCDFYKWSCANCTSDHFLRNFFETLFYFQIWQANHCKTIQVLVKQWECIQSLNQLLKFLKANSITLLSIVLKFVLMQLFQTMKSILSIFPQIIDLLEMYHEILQNLQNCNSNEARYLFIAQDFFYFMA